MKRFTKVCLWIFGICLVLGILLGSISWALGFRGWHVARWGSGHLEETYEKMEGEIRGLELHVQAGDIFVEEGDEFAITGKTEGKPLSSVVEDGIWKLSAGEDDHDGDASFGGFYVDNEGIYWKASLGEVHITIPRGAVLDQIIVDVEAGSVEIDNFSCRDMEIDLQAGSVNFHGDVKEDLLAECQAGSIEGLLAGEKTDFGMNVECSVGSVSVGGSTWAGLFMDEEIESGSRKKEMSLSCDAGSIVINFFEEE